MKNQYYYSIPFLTLTFSRCARSHAPDGKMEFPGGAVRHAVHVEDMQWRPYPPNLPSGCEVAVLKGSPKEPGSFAVRFRASGEFVRPPHMHPKEERVTIFQRKAYVVFGKDEIRENAKILPPGKANMVIRVRHPALV